MPRRAAFLPRAISWQEIIRNRQLVLWPVLGLCIALGLWFSASRDAAEIRAQGEAAARRNAAGVANSYAQQLGHTVHQIDQITLRLKYHWEDPDIALNLEEEKARGLFPESNLLYASIFDANGDPATTTVSGRSPTNVADLPYFQFHRDQCCGGLLISEPSASRFMGRNIVRFTRRLNKPDGSFDGVAIVSVEPPFLIIFQENAVPGNNDFVSVRLATGPLLASKVGTQSQTTPFIFYRKNPLFDAPAGVTLEPAEKFRDNRARFVAWKKLQKYPLVAIAAFSVDDALAPYVRDAERRQRQALIQGFLILAVSLVTAYVTYRATRRRREVEETRETYRAATDAANEAFYMIRPILDREGQVVDFRLEDCNNRTAELIGTTRDRLVGLKVSEMEPDRLRDELLRLCHLGLKKGFIEEELRVPPQSVVKAKWIYRRIVRSGAGLAVTVRDISSAKEQEQALSDLANNDVLTKLPNRHWLNGYLPQAVTRASSHEGHLAVLFIDLDNFKNINDTLGHEAGDELLIQAAHRLKSAVRASDQVTRLGGDEFVVILENVHVEEDVSRVAKAIVAAVGKPYSLASGTGNEVNASIGISMYPQDGQDAETLLKHADVAMYAAKAAGKGRYAYYHSHLSDSLILRLSKERALREAVDEDQFVVHYQPRVGIRSGSLTSMEALVRWERPQHGLVYPSEFIDTAEDMGLIVRLGERVIEKVCRQLAEWQAQGLTAVPVSINVSPQQLKAGTLSTFLADCIRRHRIPPQLIEAELTESAVIDRSNVVTAELRALRELGIKLMIDDFGTGYSSMAQLHRLDVDVLKVDQAFTTALGEGREAKVVFKAIMSMAEALDICVVAEGVETMEQVNILHGLNCDEIQGHLVSRAVSAAEMAPLMLKRVLLVPRGPGRLAPV
ncbi:MAG TPA: EAL domain-containing protein [Noviherbaspirillum sp.]|uniref:bifunctional diguanylate cyclase/phosphodiesterase n=1 Tax=Noviherbaspirillum sp. TaxID=1926288 RepID=UPI002D6A9B5F|nr:EAL domain-containing protein [Noviherbaspirillum sp.]HYD95994.1 EAL domain-containing protein [Noviherbaspirillum sp.]